MNSLNDIWQEIIRILSSQLTPTAITTWFSDCEPVEIDDCRLVLHTTTDFKRSIINSRFGDMIKAALSDLFSCDFDLLILAGDEINEYVNKKKDDNSLPEMAGYTFDRFIVGPSNKFAHAAAQAVAANPSGAYNPLFIWGGSGLGKTHLLGAIQFEIHKNFPDYNIVYVDGEKFTNEIISAIHDNTTAEFHNKYRAADVLLVDDIQFIGGKESTQEEFFHTFNTLYNAGKQIVLVSDRPPKEIKSLEERLRTRFEMGLTADIQPPDFETRVAIIRRKADLLGLEMPDEVAEYIANRLKNNIRQLEGAVKKLNAYRKLEGIQPVIGAAQNAIKDILNETQPVPITVEKILSEVARTYNTTADMLRGPSRRSNVSSARKVSMYVVREITGMSMEDIGSEFGGRDHSTVVYSINDMQKKLETDTRLRETVEDIIKNVRT